MSAGLKNTQAAIRQRYDVDERGIVRSPGKFEGQPAYVVWMWELCMLGRVREIRGIYYLDLFAEDIDEWPTLRGKRVVQLQQCADGSIMEVD